MRGFHKKYGDLFDGMKQDGRRFYRLFVCTTLFGTGAGFLELVLLERLFDAAQHIFAGTLQYRAAAQGILLLLALTALFKVIGLFAAVLKKRVLVTLQRVMMEKLLRQCETVSWEYFEHSVYYQRLYETQQKLPQLLEHYVDAYAHFLQLIPYGVIYTYFLLRINVVCVFVYAVLLAVVNFGFFRSVSDKLNSMWNAYYGMQRRERYYMQISGDKVSHQEYRFYQLFDYVYQKWCGFYEKEQRMKERILVKNELFLQLSRLVYNLPYFFLMFVTAYGVLRGRYAVGFLVMANQLLNSIMNLIEETQRILFQKKVDDKYLAQFREIMAYKKEQPAYSGRAWEQLTVADVAYRYPQAEKDSVNGLSFTVRRGEKLAVVGDIGSGKTTTIALLLSFLEKREGFIGDGKGAPVCLRGQAACIFQNFDQYQMSIRENIAVGDLSREIGDDELWDILEKVGLKEHVARLACGLDTMLGELMDGEELSKGQWQRLAVARLLAKKDAALWILDEPTAYLDPVSEIALYRLVFRMAGERTVFFISHRLGFARHSQRILVFSGGKVAEEGTHEQLMAAGGKYSRMYRSQERWYTGENA